MINSIGLPNKGLDGLPGRGPAADRRLPQRSGGGLRSAARAGDHERDGLDRRGARRARRGLRRARGDRGDRAECLLPERRRPAWTSAPTPPSSSGCWRPCARAPRKPLIVKLTPNAADVPACALGAEAGGADAVSLINTLRAAALAPGRLARGRGWAAGPAGSRARRSVPSPSRRSPPSPRRSKFPSSGWGAFSAPSTRASCSTWGPRSSPSAPRASAIRRAGTRIAAGLVLRG